ATSIHALSPALCAAFTELSKVAIFAAGSDGGSEAPCANRVDEHMQKLQASAAKKALCLVMERDPILILLLNMRTWPLREIRPRPVRATDGADIVFRL